MLQEGSQDQIEIHQLKSVRPKPDKPAQAKACATKCNYLRIGAEVFLCDELLFGFRDSDACSAESGISVRLHGSTQEAPQTEVCSTDVCSTGAWPTDVLLYLDPLQ
jgi:hypothetical protein